MGMLLRKVHAEDSDPPQVWHPKELAGRVNLIATRCREAATKRPPPTTRWNTPLVLLALVAVLVGALSLALLLISRPPGNDSPEAGFARDMIVHHAQAVQMADMVRDRAESDAMRLLAADIELTQQAQIGMMQGWLEAWGLSITDTEPAMAWMGHPTDGLMPGMATPEEVNRLGELPPNRADVLFLRLMIVHHQGAIPMAEAILKRTERPEVRQLAESIETSQRAEIENMKAMLKERVGDSAEVDLEPANGSGSRGTATLSKTDGSVKVVLKVLGLPNSGTMYLAHIHPGTCAEEEGGASSEHYYSGHEHGTHEAIEYPLTPVQPDSKGNGSSTTVVRGVTLEGLLSGEPKHVNVHEPGSGEPPPVTCANLNEAL
jgi:uncharacterized protein (DUF305 family)